MGLKAAVLVASDRASAGTQEDKSGPEAASRLTEIADVIELRVVPDDAERIKEALIEWCDSGVDIIVTSGGTGFSTRDVTPEATRAVIEREAPGIITGLVVNGLSITPRAVLSRGVAGIRASTLIVNVPGSPKAVREAMDFLIGILPHAVEMLRGGDHAARA